MTDPTPVPSKKKKAKKPRMFKSRLARRRHFAKQVRVVVNNRHVSQVLTDLAERVFGANGAAVAFFYRAWLASRPYPHNATERTELAAVAAFVRWSVDPQVLPRKSRAV